MNPNDPNPNQMRPSDLPTSERLATAATGMMSAIKTQTAGEKGEHATHTMASTEMVKAYTESWPAMSKKSAEQTIAKYGLPNEALPSRLIWYNNLPWKRTIVYRDEIPHNFPQPHSDVIENFIDYQVPPDKASELARFDGSVIVERTKGEVSARCDMEAANILALNMMHEIVQGRLTAEQAREKYSEQTAAYVLNRPAPYAEVLQFQLPTTDTTDTDHVTIGPDLLDQSVEKVKDIFRS
ncbi:hypothetical protein GCM10023185_33560 [Hymenobacter saemangeumensis]|uniref:Uncharacterized protein n=1 Tax=Hymenobacter saemangeumensis TaxID=1084522 RepID=A0ABP8INI0_9BACT